jgi:hypothetical protein
LFADDRRMFRIIKSGEGCKFLQSDIDSVRNC